MKTILVIEDDYVIRENILKILKAEGFDVMGAENGMQGLSLAMSNLPDVILCDVLMPELNGYGVLMALRANPATATVPFVFLTGKADRAEIRQGMELGADDYLTKPFTKAELVGAIALETSSTIKLSVNSNSKLLGSKPIFSKIWATLLLRSGW